MKIHTIAEYRSALDEVERLRHELRLARGKIDRATVESPGRVCDHWECWRSWVLLGGTSRHTGPGVVPCLQWSPDDG